MNKAAVKLLNDVGHENVNEALRHMARMQTALKVIHTWMSQPEALNPQQVREACMKALNP